MTQPHAIVELQDLGYRVGSREILDGISWRIDPGEHWAVVGANGAGKTTLLRMVCGDLWPNAGGRVLRDGRALCDLREVRKRFGWVSATLLPRMPADERVLDTVVSGRFGQIGLTAYAGVEAATADFEQARAHLAQMGCEHLAEQRFGTLSQGEKQKVLTCRALIAEPRLLMLDEPCAGLDPGARERLLDAIQSLGRSHERMGLVFVTQHVEEIMPIFEHTLAMADGRILECGPTARVMTSQLVERLYGLRTKVLEHQGRYWTLPMPR